MTVRGGAWRISDDLEIATRERPSAEQIEAWAAGRRLRRRLMAAARSS